MNRIETEEGEYGWRQAGVGTVTGPQKEIQNISRRNPKDFRKKSDE